MKSRVYKIDMLISIVGLNLQDLSVQYIRTENVSIDRELVLYESNEFIVPKELDPRAVKGKRDEIDSTIIHIIEDPDKNYAWKEMRRLRAQKLAESDWTQMADVSMSDEKRKAWIEYRQQLRDLPNTITDPLNIVWPNTPL